MLAVFVLSLLSVKVGCGRGSKMGKQRENRTKQNPRIGDLLMFLVFYTCMPHIHSLVAHYSHIILNRAS